VSSTSRIVAALRDDAVHRGQVKPLGGGLRLFDQLGTEQVELETTRVVQSPAITHLRFRVVK
jgi:hypothetical protein